MKSNLINNKLFRELISRNEVRKITEIFSKKDIVICFVGGCVRDIVIGKKIFDVDFAINCKPEVIIKILKENRIKFEDYAKKYGSIIAEINKKKLHITSLREDYNQKGRATEILFTEDWEKDALRRDFTMNAMYLFPNGQLHDYFGGQEDIKNQKIKFIGNIKKRIAEDYIRIFRFYRFLGCFKEIKIIDGYETILSNHIPKIHDYIDNETMRNEILKMFKNPYPKNSFADSQNLNEKNYLINTINQWWIKEKFNLGIEKCLNKVNNYFL